MPDRLTATIDYAQSRLRRDRICMTVAGLEWNGPVFADTWIDPVTNTLMLRPPLEYDSWYTSNTGNYHKPGIGDGLTLSPGNAFLGDGVAGDPPEIYPGAGTFLSTSQAGDYAQTDDPVGKNRAVTVSFFIFNSGDDYIALDCGWGPAVEYSSGIGLRVRSGGEIEVYKGGAFQAKYSISGFASGQNAGNKFVELMLIPCRKRELLVVSNQGGGFTHVFEDIAEDDADPEITPDERFWVQNISGAMCAQIAPMYFPSTGYATSLDIALMFPPETGSMREPWVNSSFTVTDAKVYGDPAYEGTTDVLTVDVVGLDGATTFTPDDTTDHCRLKITLTGDGSYTPFVYGAHAAYAQDYVDTDDSEEAAIESTFLSAHLEVPDEGSGVRFTCDVVAPETLESTVWNLLNSSGRPFLVQVGTTPILNGETGPPEYTDSLSDETAEARITVPDKWKALEDYMFRERVPLDGLPLCLANPDGWTNISAISFVLACAGVPYANMDLDDVAFVIDSIAPKKCGEAWNFIIEVGDTAARVIERLHEQFAASFLYGFKPTATLSKFWFKDPDSLSDTPTYFLYRSIESAITGLQSDMGMTEEEAIAAAESHLYGEYKSHPLEVEANEIRATGWDIRLDVPIQAYKIDTASQDPTGAPSTHPDNWVGKPRIFGVISPKLTSQEACNQCAEYLYNLLTKRRVAAEWSMDGWLFDAGAPLWRFDVVSLEGRGTYRIASLTVDFDREYNDEDDTDMVPVRSVRMTGIQTGTGWPSGKGGSSLRALVWRNRLDAVNRTKKYAGWELLTPFKPSTVIGI